MVMSEAQVKLRPHTEADLPNYVTWLNDPEVTEFTALEAGNVTLEGEREWLARVSDPACRERNWAIEACPEPAERVDGRHVGNCALHLHESGEMAGVGIIIGDKTQWSKGYGTAALREVLRIGFEEMGLQRIHLQAFAGNARGIRCYEKCGFRHEGLLREARFKRGEWRDTVTMAILREDWQEAHQAPADDGQTRIRAFSRADYDQVAALWEAVGFRSWPTDTRDLVAGKLRRDPDLFLVADIGARIIGTVMGAWDGWRGWAYNVAVHPSHRRQGIGRRLMFELEKRLWAKGARVLNLHYFNESTWARDFYHSLGFQDGTNATLTQKVLREPIP
jgi:RimJ/RimL family protein N-acetyltransferase